jgi:divalent metal cation (Fe/Co/Zn/Cd) transporter
MEITGIIMPVNRERQYKNAFLLALLSIALAFTEALFSTFYGYTDESITLFGFGVGSFIEIISAIGVAHMITRLKQNENGSRDNFERTALRITGFGFYILSSGLVVTIVYNIWTQHKPETTVPGIIISILSIAFMLLLLYGKTITGKLLNSDAILADANCTKVCIYMSIVLLTASGLYVLTQFQYIDDIGTLGIAWFSFREGKECFEKARSNKICCCK